jgi:hypothetical protein
MLKSSRNQDAGIEPASRRTSNQRNQALASLIRGADRALARKRRPERETTIRQLYNEKSPVPKGLVPNPNGPARTLPAGGNGTRARGFGG